MAISQYTLQEAKELLEIWKKAEKQLAEGQVKSYRIGTRELTALDLKEITERIRFFSNIVDALSSGRKMIRVRRIVPRDL